MRTRKFGLGLLIVALMLGAGASAFWAARASGGSPSLEVKTYQPGWANVPWLEDTMPVDAALSSIADSVGAVYYLDPDSGGWQHYIPGRSEGNELTTMAFGRSYWFLFTEPVETQLVTEPEDICPPDGCPPCPTPGPECPASVEVTTHIRTVHGTVTGRETGQVTSSCRSGEVLTGGGYSVGSIGFNDKVFLNAPIDEQTWAVSVFNNNDATLDVWVSAICAEFGE